MSFPTNGLTLYGAWVQSAESMADLDTRLKQRGVCVMDAPYLAKGDGIADDTAAIRAAITAVTGSGGGLSAIGGGIVYLPVGIYKTTSTIDIPRNVLLRGAGWGSIVRSSVANPILRVTADAIDSEARGIEIADLQIDGTSIASGLTGLYLVKWGTGGAPTIRTSAISRVRVINCSVGMRLIDTQGLAVRDSKFDSNGTGVYISDNSQIGVFENCDFRANTIVGLLLEASAGVIGGVADRIYDWSFILCHFESNVGKGCILDGAINNIFINSKWEQNGDDYLTLQSTVSGYRNDSNIFMGGTWNASPGLPAVKQVNIINASGTTFVGGQFSAAASGGIVIAAGGWRTLFIQTAINGTITDNAAANVGTSYLNPALGRYAMERTVFPLTDAANIAVDASQGDVQAVTLGGNRTLSAPTKTRSGQQITFLITQDGTGGRNLTIAWVSNLTFSNLGNSAGAVAVLTVVYDGANWKQVSFVPYNNTLSINSLVTARRTVVANYNVTSLDQAVFADATAGPITVTLPNATFFPGIIFTVKKIDSSANGVTVGGGGLTLDGAASRVLLTQYDSIIVQSDGANWQIIGASRRTIASINGATWVFGEASELLVLSTVGTTTDTAGNLLPANAIIEGVVARLTTAITVATDWKLGDPTTAGRFSTANANMALGSTSVGLQHQQGSVATDAAGPVQTAAAKVRVTTTGIPGAGAVRITVFYRQLIAPSS